MQEEPLDSATPVDGVKRAKDNEGHPVDEGQIVRDNMLRYQYGMNRGHRNYSKLAARLEGYYLGGDRDYNGKLRGGGQWDDEDLFILDEQGRPAYEFNQIWPAIQSAVGYQIHNRMDIAFHPRGGDATKELAEVRSKVAMQIADNNNLHWSETEVFTDGLIQQRGYFDVRMDFSDSLFGELKIVVLDPVNVIPDPDAQSYDPSGWSDVIVVKWMTIADIEGLYGYDAAEKVRESIGDWREQGSDESMDYDDVPRNRFGDGRRDFSDAWYSSGGRGSERHVRVIERQKWVHAVGDVAIYPEGDIRHLSGDETIEALNHIRSQGAFISKRRIRRVRWTVSTPDVLIHDSWSPYDRFTIVPFFPFFRRGRTRGMVDNAIGPQSALNKAVSQYIHIINTTANSGWIVEENSLTNMSTDQLMEQGAQTGLVIEHKRNTKEPRKIQPNSVPPGVDHLISRATSMLKEVTVPDAMRGTQGPELSGIAIQSRQHAAQQTMALQLDSLSRTRSMVGRWIDYAVGKYYDNQRVFRITKTEPVTGQEVVQEMVINEWDASSNSYYNDMTVGEYDVVISEQPMQVTFENSQFNQSIEMRKHGIAVPDAVVIRNSNLSDKHEIVAQMEAAQQSAMQGPPEDPLLQAEMALRAARAEKEMALARKHDAEAVLRGVEGMYSATQAAATIVQAPTVAPLADGLLRSAGFVDKDAGPIVPGADVPVEQQQLEMPDVHENTSPMFPPRANPDGIDVPETEQISTQSPSEGMMQGVETQEVDDGLQ